MPSYCRCWEPCCPAVLGTALCAGALRIHLLAARRCDNCGPQYIPFFTRDALAHYAEASWRCRVCGLPPHGKVCVGVCPNPTATHHPTCATQLLSKNAHTVEWSTFPLASSTGPPRRSKRPCGRRRSAARSIRLG